MLIRRSQPKNKPKPVAAAKPVRNGTDSRGERGRGGKRGRNAGRAKPKTADQLDAEMTDYFVANDANGAATGMDTAANGTAQPAAHGGDDLGMDEILVGDLGFLPMDMYANSWASER